MRNEKQDSFRAHDEAVHARAKEAFRQRRMRRNGARAGVALAVIFVAGILIAPRSWRPQVEVKEVQSRTRQGLVGSGIASGSSEMKDEANAKESKRSTEGEFARELNDEELLAIFPEGSCFMAEVNGRKTLVFHDPAVRAKFFN